MAYLEIKDLSFTYGGSEAPALNNLCLSVERGDFVLVCGESGCGKTTLLRLLKRQLRPNGRMSGEITLGGEPLDSLDERRSVSEIGYVMQSPENQTVTDRVSHELAFGLESLGEPSDTIRRKVAEIAGFFGIESWYHRSTDTLSGGQKQLLSLASVMVMDPELLILDEPTAQLDPIAASDFLASLRRINAELGVTVIIAEHRLEEVFPMASRVVLMHEGEVFMTDTPRGVGARLSADPSAHSLSMGLPAAVRLFTGLGAVGECPLTPGEGKGFLAARYENDIRSLPLPEPPPVRETVLSLTDGYFRYEHDSADVLRGIDLSVYENELLCILGANGAGKSTLLRVLAGVKRLYRGKYRLFGKRRRDYSGVSLYRENIACLPQNPALLFVKSTVREDLFEAASLLDSDRTAARAALDRISCELGVAHLLDRHPYDLSGGEQQKAALAKVLLMRPRILLLDEPTKGLDPASKRELASLLARLKSEGKTVVIVTHDVEFAAEHADRCAMFFDGTVVSSADRVSFFSQNRYYTTAAARMSRPMFDSAVTVDDIIALCRLNREKGGAV